MTAACNIASLARDYAASGEPRSVAWSPVWPDDRGGEHRGFRTPNGDSMGAVSRGCAREGLRVIRVGRATSQLRGRAPVWRSGVLVKRYSAGNP
jgi:hypothetical protein